MDVIMVGPWTLSAQNRDLTMDVIMGGPWMLSAHGCHHGWAMDAVFSERIR